MQVKDKIVENKEVEKVIDKLKADHIYTGKIKAPEGEDKKLDEREQLLFSLQILEMIRIEHYKKLMVHGLILLHVALYTKPVKIMVLINILGADVLDT